MKCFGIGRVRGDLADEDAFEVVVDDEMVREEVLPSLRRRNERDEHSSRPLRQKGNGNFSLRFLHLLVVVSAGWVLGELIALYGV